MAKEKVMKKSKEDKEADDGLLMESYKATFSELEELGLLREKIEAQIREKFTEEEIERIEKLKKIEDEKEWEEIRKLFDRDNKERDIQMGWWRVAEKIKRMHIFKTMKDTREVYFYNTKKGIYEKGGEKLIESITKRVLGNYATTHTVTEIISHVSGTTFVDRDIFDKDITKIVVENGILNIMTGKLTPHTPEFLSTVRVPLVYDPEADCPKIKKFIKEVVEEEKVDAIYELFGYCLYRRYHINRAFMFNGEGNNGKSTLINLLKAFLGKENYATVQLQMFGKSRFSASRLYGKLANLSADLPSKPLRETGIFKMLTGEDSLEAEQKFKDGFSFQNYSKLIFSANRVPPVEYDDTDAFFRRWVIINFPNQFPEDDPKTDKNLIDKITTQLELSGLLNIALEGLRRLLKNGQFTGSLTPAEMREIYTKLSDPTKAFVIDCVDKDLEGWVEKKLLYNAFCEYCREKNYIPVTEKRFSMRLRQIVRVETGKVTTSTGKRVYAWKGIRLIESESEDIREKRGKGLKTFVNGSVQDG